VNERMVILKKRKINKPLEELIREYEIDAR
jgi:hypothetical protein